MQDNNIFKSNYVDKGDKELISSVLNGSKSALETLIKKHQNYIYNIAFKMVLSPFDAEDICQEVLIKMITKLSQFKGESNFRTWLYRITFTHFLQMKKYWLEDYISTFDNYGDQLDAIRNQDLDEIEKAELKEYVEDAKLACMNGMLLCLDRDQRLIYILGEIFEIDHSLGAELLEISKDNFRQRLSRARKNLYQFMNKKCGLINKSNPCRCDKKTKGFIQAGWVDAENLKFNVDYIYKINQLSTLKTKQLDAVLDTRYAELFRDQPFQEKDHCEKLLNNILQDREVKSIFEL
jgi:RNA polymerase sigma factor (sigma-70 family)